MDKNKIIILSIVNFGVVVITIIALLNSLSLGLYGVAALGGYAPDPIILNQKLMFLKSLKITCLIGFVVALIINLWLARGLSTYKPYWYYCILLPASPLILILIASLGFL